MLSDEETRKILANNIKKFVDRGLLASEGYVTPEILADEIGITVEELNSLKDGTSEPTAIVLFKLCELLDVDMNRMLRTTYAWYQYVQNLASG